MKSIPKPFLCILLAVISAVSSYATESPKDARFPTSTGTIVTARKTLSPQELEKYKGLRSQHGFAVSAASAGASDTTKKVVIIVGCAVVVVGILALVATHGGKTAYGGSLNFK